MYCPVHLPDGATVGQLSCKVYDNDSSGYINVYLYYSNFTGTNYTMAYANTTTAFQSASVTTISDATISYAEIDNQTRNYYLRVYLNPNTTGSSYIRYYNCQLQYSLTTLNP